MKTISIFLKTKDPDYDMALSKGLQHHSNFFSIQADYPQMDNHEYDLILTDDMNASAERTVYLTDDPASERVNEENVNYILYKYQHVGHISNMLRLAHSVYSKSEMLSDDTEQANIISICTASGGIGCTSVALGICQELVRFHGKKVLYISLEEFESTATYFPELKFETNNISKFLYYILNNNENRSCTPEGYLIKDEYGVFAFHPARGRNPLRELTGNEFVKFINHITVEKIFTDLIIDGGNGLDASIISAYQLSAIVCHVIGKNPDFNRRANYLLTVTNRVATKDSMGFSKDSLGFLNVFNRYVEPEEEDADNFAGIVEKFIIEEDSASFEVVNGRTVISLDKMFGQGIRDIVHHLILPKQ